MSFALTTGGAANQLVVSRTGSGTGVITSSPAGISCGTTCSAYFASTAVVTLLASPDAGSIFSGWGVDLFRQRRLGERHVDRDRKALRARARTSRASRCWSGGHERCDSGDCGNVPVTTGADRDVR
ncbi:MAG: hypothetical protein KGL93_14485 [Gemmatimonadota bacterium]|nr:hypothetical protein [Gemmatimonadota bacterium]